MLFGKWNWLMTSATCSQEICLKNGWNQILVNQISKAKAQSSASFVKGGFWTKFYLCIIDAGLYIKEREVWGVHASCTSVKQCEGWKKK